ncbi:uncharacterized protein LOC130277028 [Hyla sarda]|uniref:uncharacterized protein LOC130277028 n=1 Tax=Hyla sarda TaxID=327740 RepID=UPI0024C3B7C9|nr:uncharacterized protein LOC130277028 [Hyla sarda]
MSFIRRKFCSLIEDRRPKFGAVPHWATTMGKWSVVAEELVRYGAPVYPEMGGEIGGMALKLDLGVYPKNESRAAAEVGWTLLHALKCEVQRNEELEKELQTKTQMIRDKDKQICMLESELLEWESQCIDTDEKLSQSYAEIQELRNEIGKSEFPKMVSGVASSHNSQPHFTADLPSEKVCVSSANKGALESEIVEVPSVGSQLCNKQKLNNNKGKYKANWGGLRVVRSVSLAVKRYRSAMKNETQIVNTAKRVKSCFACGGSGHIARYCKAHGNKTKHCSAKCTTCGHSGHISTSCYSTGNMKQREPAD